jgi:PhzF family phenazine biosynthesis protein
MPSFTYSVVDVFAAQPFAGNPVAVVHDADALTDRQLQDFARWTNLSETTFLLPPTDPAADYRLRIFTPATELPFAGHPTLGSAAAWLDAGGALREGRVVQECGAGLVTVRTTDTVPGALAFAAPPFLRSGRVDAGVIDQVVGALGIRIDDVRHAAWIDNGPGWIGLVLDSAQQVLALRPRFHDFAGLKLGVIGPHAAGPDRPADYEVRAFCPGYGLDEDPVTGSLNAGFGVWLTEAGLAPASYTVRQGTVMGRNGLVGVERDGDTVWVSGGTQLRVRGSVEF